MIEAFSLATAHLYQDALASQARLRYDVFVKQRGLDHSSFDELEFDEFDTPSALYLVWRDGERRVRGMARLLVTNRPYMLARYWPFLVKSGALPNSSEIWEVTRVCVDRTLAPEVRRTVFPELLSAIAEFFQANGFAGMVGVTRQHLLSHFIREGIEWLGDEALIEGEVERAFFVPTAHIRPVYFCRKYAIPGSVLKEHPPTPFRRAA
ncbi:N-acyl-L-homoserine lactone synthetase [Bradyrhizobium sp. USDA 4011]